MIDCIVRGATVVDGTGATPMVTDVAVDGGRIVEVGPVTDDARRIIDGDGLVCAPGFVDLHTHYDAQLFWDPTASPSPLHGVTTVIGGNCGFSLAPVSDDDADYLTKMMAKVEGMPLSALEAGLDWKWRSFGEWLARLEGQIGVNAGFLVGHSALRRSVMGDRSVGEAASMDDVEAMAAQLRAALGQGALGFSSSQAHTHNDGSGQPVPSRAASRGELEALAAVAGEFAGTTLEMIVAGCLSAFSDDEMDLLATMSRLAQRPLNWNVLAVSSLNPGGTEHQLGASDVANSCGGLVKALTLPHTMRLRLSFEHGAILEGLPGWRELFALPISERAAVLSDPQRRRELDASAHTPEAGLLIHLANWSWLVIDETFAPINIGLEGRSIGSIAAERGQDPFDTLCEIIVADKLLTGFKVPIPELAADWTARAAVWRDPRVIVGGSDAGAHLDTMCGAIYSTSMLAQGVREHEVITMAEAVRLLTDVPARFYGLRDRGRIAPGFYADLVVFDPLVVGHEKERRRDDLPGGANRLFAAGVGFEHVLVNGTEVVHSDQLTGALSGSIIRSGTDTDTVSVSG